MASIVLYSRLPKEEIDKIYKDSIVNISAWFEQNPKRRICRMQWIYGKSCKIRRKFIEEDLKAIYNQTILETFKN